jgi:hypothetical protein
VLRQIICRPCLVDTEGRKANPTEAEVAKEADWRCEQCAEFAAAFSVRSSVTAAAATPV